MSKIHYRYVDSYGPNNEITFSIEHYLVLKETPCGYWISKIWDTYFDNSDPGSTILSPEDRTYDHQYYEDDKVWVSKTSMKRKAHPTKKEALESYIARKTKQVKILEIQLRSARVRLSETLTRLDIAAV